MTLITTVTFAAAFQVPGGYDGNGKAILVKNKQFRYFLTLDTLSFGFSAASLLLYFGMPIIQKMTLVQNLVQRVMAFLSAISLAFMILAFSGGVTAVLDEKSSLYSLIDTTSSYCITIPIYLFGIFYMFIIPLTNIRNILRPFRSWSSFQRLSISRGLVVLAPEFVLSFLPHHQMIPFRQLFCNPCALASSLFYKFCFFVMRFGVWTFTVNPFWTRK